MRTAVMILVMIVFFGIVGVLVALLNDAFLVWLNSPV